MCPLLIPNHMNATYTNIESYENTPYTHTRILTLTFTLNLTFMCRDCKLLWLFVWVCDCVDVHFVQIIRPRRGRRYHLPVVWRFDPSLGRTPICP
jgi:hypothetical protein